MAGCVGGGFRGNTKEGSLCFLLPFHSLEENRMTVLMM